MLQSQILLCVRNVNHLLQSFELNLLTFLCLNSILFHRKQQQTKRFIYERI